MQSNVRQMKTTAGPHLKANLLKSKDIQLEMPLLKRTNDFYNQVPYFTDLEHWGVDDYWATPVELVASFGGDCEDYAIAKYMTLKDLGVPVERLRIAYVRAIKIGETHMVLAYYPTPDSDPWILDNLIPEIKHGSERTDLIPVYSFNDDDLWLANGTARKGGASTVRLWRDVIEKWIGKVSSNIHPEHPLNKIAFSNHLRLCASAAYWLYISNIFHIRASGARKYPCPKTIPSLINQSLFFADSTFCAITLTSRALAN